ncbi:hypothetical protein DAI22_01g234800 [Oryza sativa Japonica Group]|nr:hypothetical protein DAI22_01g234800 [Oryza sativa Japonica Group]
MGQVWFTARRSSPPPRPANDAPAGGGDPTQPPPAKSRKTSHRTAIDSLGEDLLLDIFLRLPTLASLVRAALTCRAWRAAVASSPSFRRRFRDLHPPPLLGVFCDPRGHGLARPRPGRPRGHPRRRLPAHPPPPRPRRRRRAPPMARLRLPGRLPPPRELRRRIGRHRQPHGPADDRFHQYALSDQRFCGQQCGCGRCHRPRRRIFANFPRPTLDLLGRGSHVIPAGLAATMSPGCRQPSSQMAPTVGAISHIEARASPVAPHDGNKHWLKPGMQANGLIFWPFKNKEHMLVLDTNTMKFTVHEIPVFSEVQQGCSFAVSETKDDVPCIVCVVGTTVSVWMRKFDEKGVERWRFADSILSSEEANQLGIHGGLKVVTL